VKHRFALVVAIFACVALVLVSGTQMVAQEKKAAAAPLRYSGRVNILSKDNQTITIQAKSGSRATDLVDPCHELTRGSLTLRATPAVQKPIWGDQQRSSSFASSF